MGKKREFNFGSEIWAGSPRRELVNSIAIYSIILSLITQSYETFISSAINFNIWMAEFRISLG